MTTWMVRLHERDERLLHALVLRRRRYVDPLMRGVTHLGDAALTIGLSLALLFGAFPGLDGAGRRAAFALAASHLVVQVVKRTVCRARPRLPMGCEFLMHPPDRFSFPSGHAASSLSVALGLAAVLPASLGAPVVALACVVGLSRCYLGVHYPGDVLMGWLLAGLGAVGAGVIFG
jgi:undecaprenyl-diphosphatase